MQTPGALHYTSLMSNAVELVSRSPEFSDFLFDNLSSAIFLLDKDLKVQKVNNSFKALFSTDDLTALNQLCGNSLGCSFAVEQDKLCGTTTQCDFCEIRGCIGDSMRSGDSPRNAYIDREFYINGQALRKHFRIKARKIVWKDEDFTIVVIDDITDLEEQKDRIRDMANRDYLSGLYNRRFFFEIAESLYQNAKRHGAGFAVAMFDIDDFKRINDTYGHGTGDSVIQAVSSLFSSNIRKADVVARFGGEEFCLILHCAAAEDAYSVVDKLRLLVEQNRFSHGDVEIPVRVSAGLTTSLGESLNMMLERADEALYKAKRSGKNRTVEIS